MYKLIELFEPVQGLRSKESPLPGSPVWQRFDAERNEAPSPEGQNEYFRRDSYIHRESREYHATSSLNENVKVPLMYEKTIPLQREPLGPRDRLVVGGRTYLLLHDP